MKKNVKAKYPEKTSMNLVMKDETQESSKLSIGIFALFLVLLGVFVKFGVIDQLSRANAAEATYNQMQREITTLTETNKEYNEVQAEYNHYSNSFLNDDEKTESDRMQVISLLEACVLNNADVQSFQLTGNDLTLTINDTTLDTVSKVVAALQADERTNYVTVSTAATNTQQATSSQPVTANIIVHLTPAGGATS